MNKDSITRFSVERSIDRLSTFSTQKSISYTNYLSSILTQSHAQYYETHSETANPPLAPSSQTQPTNSFAAVPQRIALAPDRFYIWHQGDFERWAIPIQLTELEARSLLPLVEGERDRAVILKIVESAIVDGGAS